MNTPNIKVDLSSMLNAQKLAEELFPLVSQAVGAVAAQAQIMWKDGVMQARLWSGEKTPYMNSITWAMTGPFSAEVKSDYPLAYEIENGRPAKDLKKMLDTSDKVRTTKDGRRFMVIPFRHNTPGNDALAMAMPPNVYDLASKMEKSSVISDSGQRASGEVTNLSPTSGMMPSAKQTPFASNIKNKSPLMVKRMQYQWGDKLPAGMAPKMKPEHKTDIYAGMARMETSAGGQKSSAYMTFRIMMEGSSGWIIPPKPGMNLVPQIAQQLQPIAEAALTEAVKRTFMKG